MDPYIADFKLDSADTIVCEDIKQSLAVLDNRGNRLNHFEIFHNNIRSLAKNIHELKVVLNQLQWRFDCVVLTETWNLTDLTMFALEGYDVIYNEGRVNQNDGVVIYIRKDLNYIYEIVKFGEVNVVSSHIKYSNKNIHISAIYRPPSTHPNEFNKNLYNYLEVCNNMNADVDIIVGDINIDILGKKDFEEEYKNCVSEWGYFSAINNFTRVIGTSKSCIDHFIVKTREKIPTIPIILETTITDHFSIILQIPNILAKQNDNSNKRVTKTYLNKEKLILELQQTNWEAVYNQSNVTLATNRFIDDLQQKINTNTSRKLIKRVDIKRQEWITDGLITSCKTKDKLYKQMQKFPQDHNLKNKLKTYKNALNRLLNITKINYYKQLVEKNKGNSRRLWNCFRNITNSNKKSTDIKQIKTKDGNVVTTEQEIANTFNDYFNQVGSSLAENIKPKQRTNFVETKVSHSFFLKDTHIDEVLKTIMTLKLGKSPGADDITSELLREIDQFIAEPLVFIINKCFETGVFPDRLKTAVIKPIFKSGDKTICSNYRPISLISNIAKIVEKILTSRIVEYLDKFQIISQSQFGFRRARSTEDAMAALVTQVYDSLDKGDASMCIFVDLAKAFDTVSHEKLLNVLENLGFRGNTLCLLKSYLKNRTHCVSIGDVTSKSKQMTYGVPQGTVLGPVLFNIYLNDLYNITSSGYIVSFADDTAVFYRSSNWNNLKRLVQTDFVKIVQWFESRLLTINFEKTNFLPFTCYADTLPSFDTLTFHSEQNSIVIKSTKNIKYLGVYIDNHLRWDYHVDYLTKKLRSLNSKFRVYRDILGEKHLKMLYYALIHPHISYGIIAWGGVTNNYLSKLQNTHKWILKVMYKKDRFFPTNTLFTESKIFDIRQIYFEKIAVRLYSKKDNIAQIEHGYDTRLKQTSVIQRKVEKSLAQRCYRYILPFVYSQVSGLLHNIHSMGLFRKLLKRLMTEQLDRNKVHQIIERK